ncbi:MAG: hypothetical protein ACP5HK_03675 [Acidilobus sp.]
MELSLPVELTRSRSGLHARRSVVVVLGHERQEIVSKPARQGKGTYSRGEAGQATVRLSKGEVAVYIVLTIGPRKRVKGLISVYDDSGLERLRVKYERLKIRYSHGSSEFSWAVDEALDVLGLTPYVRRRNYGRRGGTG